MSLLGDILSPFGGGGGGGTQSGIGNKANSSSTENTNTTNYTDKSANAGGDNSMAIGDGANVNIQNLSEQVATTAIAAGVNQTNRALDTAEKLTEFTTNTLKGVVETSARENQQTRDSADTSLKTTASLLSALQTGTPTTFQAGTNSETVSLFEKLKPVFYIVAIIAAIVLFRSMGKGNK